MKDEHIVAFDATKQIELKLLSSDGAKAVTVRFPTDEEWTERARRKKIVIKQLGRGMSETVVPNSEDVDADLFAKIRVGDGVDVDPFEANRIIEQLAQADIDDVATEAGTFRVAMRVPGGATDHIIRMPSAKDAFEYRRNFGRFIDLPYGKQQLTVNLAVAGTLYQKLLQETHGYNGAAPIIHQAAAVKAALDALEASFAGDQTANF
jgi:hypothetical protein